MSISLKKEDPYNFFENGMKFLPHGLNRFVLYDQRATENKMPAEEFLKEMANSGMNSLRMVVPGEFEHGVEPEIGFYNESFLQKLDDVFASAEELGINIVLCLFDSTSFYASWAPDEYWKYGIYSSQFSGPTEIFTNPKLIDLMKKRAEFLVKHFSKYSNIFAWEVMNEMNKIGDLFGAESESITMKWYDEMASYIKSIDTPHLVVGSLYGDEVWESLNNSPYNDFIQIHTYDEELDPDKIAKLVTQYCIANKKYMKPVVISEFASKKNNPKRAEFVEAGIVAAQKQGCSAWLYASVWDSDAENGMGHGDMNEELFGVYTLTQPK